MPHISELDDPFFSFGRHYILGKKLVIREVMTFFFLIFTSLVFTMVGKNLGNRAGVSILLNQLSPPISKNGKKWSILLNHPPNTQHRFVPLSGRSVTREIKLGLRWGLYVQI